MTHTPGADPHDPSPAPAHADGDAMTGLPSDIRLEALAEGAWLWRFGDTIDAAVNARVHEAAARLRAHLPHVECVPAYASLLLRVDHAEWEAHGGPLTAERLRAAIEAAWRKDASTHVGAREVTVPVWYAGMDLPDIAAHARLSTDEVIARHSAPTYRVAMLGFAPGFPYLLGLDPALAMPRRSQPRISVPAGSIAIGGLQTGIYPQPLPGGWHVLGRTPLRLFDLDADPPSRLLPGDHVRFQPVDEDTYRQLAAEAGVTS